MLLGADWRVQEREINPVLVQDVNVVFKNEKRYKFASDKDAEAIRGDIRRILDKFVDQYFNELSRTGYAVDVIYNNIL